MGDLTRGRNRQCKTSVGGVSKLWLFPFTKYLRSQITRDGLSLVTFPETIIYEFESENITITQDKQLEGESQFYNQGLTVDFNKILVDDELFKIVKQDYRAIIKDNNGNFRLLGAYNGMNANLVRETGDNRASFNGSKLSLEGKESDEALFISNLDSAGFIQAAGNYLALEDGVLMFTEDNQFIIVEE
jgi:hypothetical protein